MAKNAGVLLLVFVILHTGHAHTRLSALTTTVYTVVEEQHHHALQSAEAAWHTARSGVSYDLRVRPSYRYRTLTDPLLRLRIGAGVTYAPQPPAIARAELAIHKAQHNAQLAYIRAVEAELLRHLDAHVAQLALAVAEHQARTAAENLRQLETDEEYDATLVAHAEITLREAHREQQVATLNLAAAEAALLAPHIELFSTPAVFSWRFALAAPPLSEHLALAVLVAEAEVAAALAHEQRVEPADVDAIHAVAAKYYRLIFIDSGNDESDPMWLRMIDHADQIVVATTTRDDHAEAGALLLEALAEQGFQLIVGGLGDEVANEVYGQLL